MTRSISGRTRQSTKEWIGGIAPLPSYVMGEGEPYRPEMLLWVGSDGAVIGTMLGKPGEVLGKASDSLRDTIEKPMFGQPHAPTCVRVGSAELAAVLRAGHPSIDIVCAPTPEIEDVVRAMQDHMQRASSSEQTYLVEGASPDATASFFRATAALFRSKPWKVVPPDEVVSVTVEKLGIAQAALSVIGQMEESFGFLLFSSMADFDAYLEAAAAIEQGEKPAMPKFLAMSYERGADLDTSLRKEVSSHGWEVAGSHAYPWLSCIDKDMVSRSPTADELVLIEAVSCAVTKLTSEKKAVEDAFDGGAPWLRTYSVKTHVGDIAVTLRVPHEGLQSGEGDVLSALWELEDAGALDDVDSRREIEEELSRQFIASPEGSTVSEMAAHRLLMEFAAQFVGVSIATLEPWGLDEILFEIIPSKASVVPSAASAIIEDCRAFYRFLNRAFGLEQADACLRVLGRGAEKKLEKALSNPKNFGMAKSVVMAGIGAGFDVQSKEGIEAWMRQLQSGALPPSVRLPFEGARKSGGGSHAKKKAQQKATRKSRKKNR